MNKSNGQADTKSATRQKSAKAISGNEERKPNNDAIEASDLRRLKQTVGKMIWDWEASDEAYLAFADRLVDFILRECVTQSTLTATTSDL
jgi:hypothetical protein